MNKPFLVRILLFLVVLVPSSVLAQEPAATWRAKTLWEAVAHMILFIAVGVAAAVVGYKAFDKCTPGNLHREILENKNVGAALVGAAVILGVCIIVAAAMMS